MHTRDQDQASAEEQFETCTETGEPLGLMPRSVVHARGLWHRSVHVFLFDADGRLYLQRRAADKDVCPGLWDQSAAEHLQPGESYADGAQRGLAEELGVTGVGLEHLGSPFAARLDLPELGIHDYELQQSYRGEWLGALRPDPSEVAEVRAESLDSLARWLRESPADFTPWFRRDVYRCGILMKATGRSWENPCSDR
ncbi:MAG: NUDIX domain-containing protein [Pseudomonadales bacterium]